MMSLSNTTQLCCANHLLASTMALRPQILKDGQISSITFAFEDPDGTHISCLLETSLTVFGNLWCSTKAWAPQKKNPQVSPLLHQATTSRESTLGNPPCCKMDNTSSPSPCTNRCPAELLLTCGSPNGQVRELSERGGSFIASFFHGFSGGSSGGVLEDSG